MKVHFFERKIVKSLISWKNSPKRMPLVLHGARQVGKTHTLLSFGKTHYANTVYINFEGNKEMNAVFERDLDPERIVKELSARTGQTVLKGQTLLFFDEIQASEKALSSLKYFCEQAPHYHIAAAGSLLGIAVNRQSYSFPVGKVELKTLYPLDFEEFLHAMNAKELCELIRQCFDENVPLSLHQTALDWYNTYLTTGGMPAVVAEYAEKNDFDFVTACQKNILHAYVADMAKYSTAHETAKIMAAFESVPAQLAKDNSKFQYRIIKKGARAHEYETPLDWLKASGIIIKCLKVREGKFPLTAFADNSSFKVYMSDTGLLCACYGVSPRIISADDRAFRNIKGALAENYVAAALSMQEISPFYWESDGRAEVDFVMQTKSGTIIPIETKSSGNVNSKSLSEYCRRYSPPFAVRISTRNFGFENNIKSVPLYAVFCITPDLKQIY